MYGLRQRQVIILTGSGSGEKKNIKRFFSVFLLLLSLLPLSAFGRKEARFAEIDSYIEQRDYSKALMLLQEYIIDYPEDFDSAQKRIQKIIESRAMYSAKADELINVIINEPANDQKKLQMISELEALEKNPSRSSVDFIKQTKSAAQFTYFRAQFDELMAKGSGEIEEERYADAVMTFYSGLTLYRDDFFERNYGETYTKPVLEELDSLKNLTSRFASDYETLISAYKLLQAALASGTVSTVISAFNTFQTAFTSFSLSQQAVNSSGRQFQNLFKQLSAEYNDLTEASFLPFAYRFVLGKTDSQTTGIIAAYNTQWQSLIPSLKPLFTSFIQKTYKESLSILSPVVLPLGDKTYASAEASLAQVKTILDTALSLSSLYGLRETFDGSRDTDKDALFIADTEYLLELHAFFTAQLESLKNVDGEYLSFKDYTKSVPQNADVSSSYAVRLTDTSNTLLSFLSDVTEVKNKSIGVSKRASPTWREGFTELENLSTKTDSYIISLLSRSWLDLAQYTEARSSESSTPFIDKFTEAQRLLNPDMAMDSNYETRSYPKESLTLYNSILSSIDAQLASLKEKSLLIEGSASIQSSLYSREMKTLNTSIQNLITRLSQIKNQTSSSIALANERILLAERAKNEAVLRYNQALQALKTDSFQTARDNLQRSRTKYNESLSLQDSLSLREESDKLLLDLGNAILKAENEVIVREVRALKTEAKNAYYQGNFERAESLLSQAQSRWATTNVESDSEITNLLSLVGTALSMKTGRVISPSAPLYPEMSQILSLARQFFEQGKQLLSEGNRLQGITVLNDAKQKLRELQLVYPLNQEASLLTLRIDQVIDPDAFDALFEQKFKAAKTDFRTADKRQTAYADLLDLYAINPRYAGLGDFIYQAEIELGIKIKPPDKNALAESNRLTKEASSVVNSSSRDEIALSAALVKLNTALEKNPDNEEAMVLKDRIQTIIGGKASVVLSSDSEALYQQAVQELQKGNTLQAASLVSQLLQKKENQNSSKIIDLKKKVDSLL